MIRKSSLAIVLSLCAVLSPPGGLGTIAAEESDEEAVPKELTDYVSRAEPDFGWKLAESREIRGQRVHRLELTSQTWQGIRWEHALLVYEPRKLVHEDHMLLFVTGGSNGNVPGDLSIGLALAEACGARIATLHHVPNQPLLGDHVEDDLITETWLKYLETGDTTWPLLFPMVKSAVKAMDSLEEFSQETWQTKPKGFVITGASKRGWTSWLTSAADPRIIATAPIVIDILNFPKQMKHQKETWGFYSEQIADYTSKGLVRDDGIPREGREAALWKMMDPFSYRSRITMPKLLVVGSSDRYWSVDAMNIYWNDLPGSRRIHRAANGGHDLGDGRDHALRTIAVFFRHAAAGTEMPELSWTPDIQADSIALELQPAGKPRAVKLWVARSDSTDFREALWSPEDMTGDAATYRHQVERQDGKYVAVYGDVEYEFEGLKYSLSTLVYWK